MGRRTFSQKWWSGAISAIALTFVVLTYATVGGGGGRSAHLALATKPHPVRVVTIGGQVVQIYDRAQLARAPGVHLVKKPYAVISGGDAGGLSIGGDVYAAKFVQNGRVICAYGTGDSYTGGGAPQQMTLTISLFYGGTGLDQSSPTTFGQTYMSTETDCVGAGNGTYTVYAYATADWANGTELNAAGHTSI
jgi:hypothetical protein